VHSPRSPLSALLLVTAAIAAPGCGAAGHQINGGYAAACAFHVWRLHHDLHTHHNVFAAFQAWRTIHNCPRAIQ